MDWSALEIRYLDGQQLTEEELRYASEAVGSPLLRERIVACVAILCARHAKNDLKCRARTRFESICAEMLQRQDPYKVEVLFTLLQIPAGELANSRAMRELAYQAVSSPRLSERTNSVLVLERLAREGDERAFALIREALQDPEHNVRKNAQIAVRNVTSMSQQDGSSS